MFNRIVLSFKELGFLLLLFRAPGIVYRGLRIRIGTLYWRCFLGSMGKDVKISYGVKFYRPRNVFIGDHVNISENVLFGSESANGKLFIKDRVQINRLCIIDHSGDTEIGSGTLISEGACLFSHSHGYDPKQVSQGIPKSIGTNCWIGFRAIVGENATRISDNVIIATGSIVVKSCDQSNSVYGGNPAKWIKSIETKPL